MNIIWLAPEIPYPPIGGRNGVFNRIVQLSKHNKIYLYAVAYSEDEKNTAPEMQKFCEEVHYYNRNSKRFRTFIKSLFVPYSVASRTIFETHRDIDNALNKNRIDIIIVDFPNMAKNLYGINLACYCTLNQHNNEYKRMRDMFSIKTISYFKRFAYLLESYRLEIYEKRLYRKNIFGSITFFSNDDSVEFSRKWNKCNSKLRVFPLGGNRRVNFLPSKDKNHNTLLFIGRLDKIATTNVEGVLWFCGEVLPLIRSRLDVNVLIAGANPCGSIYQLINDCIKVVPNYEKLEDVYSLADYVILPLLSGGGVKGKLLEAASFGKTIISTNHGIEGTAFKPDEHVLYGNTSKEFADQCVKAITDKTNSAYLAENARKLFEEKYEWEQICKEYHEFLQNEVKGNLSE